jgi:hypothetical protein
MVVAVLCFSAAVAWAKSDHLYPMDVPVTSEHTVAFNVQEGEFILRGDPNATSIRMEVSIDRFFIFRLGEKGILQKLIKVTREADSVSIATDIPRSIANWGRAEYPIDFVVVVPAGMNIKLHDTSGIIEVSDVTGEVAIEDGSGTLKAARLGGSLQIVKDSGDVSVQQVKGATRIDSRSGQMRFENVADLSVVNSEGNLYVANAQSAEIHNGSGNVQVIGVTGALALHDSSGEIVVRDVHGTVDITDTSGQIRASNVGAITIGDTDGNITVENAPRLKVTQKESGEVMVRNVNGDVAVPSNIKVKRKA